MGLNPEGGRARMDRDGRWGLKSWLRIVTVVLSVAGIILFGSAINDYTLVEDGGLVGRTAIDFGVLIALCCGTLWNFIDLVVHCARGRPMPPGAIVAVHLLTSLFLAAATIVCAVYVHYHFEAWGEFERRWLRELVGMIIAFVVLVLHIILFIYACCDTHRLSSRLKTMEAELSRLKLGEMPPSNGRSVVICDHCQGQLFGCGCGLHHQQPQSPIVIVAGDPGEQPPQYPPIAQEVYRAEFGKSDPSAPGIGR